MADLVRYRERFLVKPQTTAEVRITWVPIDELPERMEGETGALIPWFQCIVCSDKMIWQEEKKFFECPECGCQLTADEATSLCQMAIRSVKTLASITGEKRGFIWRLLRLFGGKRRLKSVS